MPHVTLKMFAGRSEQQKAAIAEALTKAVMATAGSAEASISVGIEDVSPSDWTETVYKPEIKAKWDTLYKTPGYDPLK